MGLAFAVRSVTCTAADPSRKRAAALTQPDRFGVITIGVRYFIGWVWDVCHGLPLRCVTFTM